MKNIISIILKIMIIQLEIEQKTCIDYPLSLTGWGVGLLLTRSSILGNEVLENRKGFLRPPLKPFGEAAKPQ